MEESFFETEVDEMSMSPAEQADFDRLKNRVKLLEERNQPQAPPISAPPQSKSPPLTTILSIVAAVVLVAGFAGGAVWAVHLELTKRDEAIGKIDKRIDSLTMAIKVLGDAQGGKTKELVDDALAIARMNVDVGNSNRAQSALSIANTFMAELKSSKVPADPSFFAESVTRFRSIRHSPYSPPTLIDEAFKGILELAEYRSTLTAPPSGFHPRYEYRGPEGAYIGHMGFVNGHQVLSDSAFYGPTSVVRGSEGGFLLDGLELQNVVFNGVTLRYHGGFLLMKNVWFVNCTFQVEQSVKGNQFLEVAALGQTSANIG